ncbi:MAG: STAS domain-containing protein [Betaproteobacteria bacterium]|nr:STAS domain-containing protein [Betaproteobacteria bacterium]
MSKPGSRAKKPASSPEGAAPRRARSAAPRIAEAHAKSEVAEPVTTGDGAPYRLPADLRIGSAAEVYAGLAALRGEVLIDGEAVAKVDAAGVQAVLAASIQISRSGGRWRWHNPSAVFIQGAAMLGLGESLRLP